MLKKIKTGVIGVGSMGRNHARVYSEISDLNGIADFDENQAKMISDKFKVPFYKNYREMLDDVDAVTISVPTIHHYEIAKYCIGKGIHVLVEKPVTDNLKDADELIKLAKSNNVKFGVGHIERFNPVVQYAKKAIESKEWGELITMSSKRLSSYPDRIRDVGVILDLASHEFDIMRYLSGSYHNQVFCLSGKKENKHFEDHASIIINFQNNIKGMCEVNWLTPNKVRQISMTFTKSFVEMDYVNQTILISKSKSSPVDGDNLYKNNQEIETKNIQLSKYEPLKAELEDFLNSIIEDRAPLVSGEDGKASLEMSLLAMKNL